MSDDDGDDDGGKAGGKTIAQKLRLPVEGRALILNPPAGYIDSLGLLPASLRLESWLEEPASGSEDFFGGTGEDTDAGDTIYDFVQIFVKDQRQLKAQGPHAWGALKYDGLLWVCYPKQSAKQPTDLNRDRLWELMRPNGLRPVTQVSIDATWSALRFRPEDAVGK